VIAKWIFGYFFATVFVESASRKPAEMMMFDLDLTACVRFGM
jgi:hypothetical protein